MSEISLFFNDLDAGGLSSKTPLIQLICDAPVRDVSTRELPSKALIQRDKGPRRGANLNA